MSEEPKHHKVIQFTRMTLDQLRAISRERQWSLSQVEMRAVQAYFKKLKREPTDVELETLAQTWSEHCKHKTLTSPVSFREKNEDGRTRQHKFKNLLKDTIFEATRRQKHDWLLSVFEDNAGIIALDAKWAVAFKVETHNHPSAIEPYGGAATGAGGVIRDVLAAGKSARPVANTDTFCVGPLTHRGEMPQGLFHPRRTLRQITAGVRDYGNRMGIPTVNGNLCFHQGFLYNPLVFCGTVGIMPRTAVQKSVENGDLIVVIGGRTGRDGIHGATFSSAAIDETATVSAVQVGNAIEEKKVMDVLLTARDQKLFRSITDCGAGGFSSAIGELGNPLGAEVHLEKAPLKFEGMEAWEIWLSESQERMVLAVGPKQWPAFKALCDSEDVEATVLGTFKDTGRLQIFHHGERVGDLTMSFLHDGLPRTEQRAEWTAPKPQRVRRNSDDEEVPSPAELGRKLRDALAHPNTCSREWIVRQYDHEVQGQTVTKPFQGPFQGPGDAAVIWPTVVTGNPKIPGVAISNGLTVGHPDPYQGAIAAIDEALRNLVCVGADSSKAALLDNFCWGDPRNPSELGSLTRAAMGCHDAAVGYGVPFISGKDSLNNTYVDEKGERHSIPGTLLISAIAPVPNPEKKLTMNLKGPENALVFLTPKKWSFDEARAIFDAVHALIKTGQVLSAHDVSDGGLAVAVAEMAFAGGIGVKLQADELFGNGLVDALFGEGLTRLVLEVTPSTARKLTRQFKEQICREIGVTTTENVVDLVAADGRNLMRERLPDLYGCWAATLPTLLDGPRAPSVTTEQEGARP